MREDLVMTDLTTHLTADQIDDWVGRYLAAWLSNDPADIAAVFAVDAESHELPYATDSENLAEITAVWLERAGWEGTGNWTFEWEQVAVNGDTFVVTGIGHYPALGDFNNLWVVTLNESGKATMFRMWNNEI
jgi:SnoaL-like domain